MVAATVRSLAHIRSLAWSEEMVDGSGQHSEIVHAAENRISPLVIHLLIGGSLLVLPLLSTSQTALMESSSTWVLSLRVSNSMRD